MESVLAESIDSLAKENIAATRQAYRETCVWISCDSGGYAAAAGRYSCGGEGAVRLTTDDRLEVSVETVEHVDISQARVQDLIAGDVEETRVKIGCHSIQNGWRCVTGYCQGEQVKICIPTRQEGSTP